MMTIVLATRNKKKVEELTRIFSGYAIRFLTLDSFPRCPEVVEDGETFRENALKKAIHVSRFTGCPSIADDSGLEVPALGGAPGILSARYAGNGADDRRNVKKLLKDMGNLKDTARDARFVCCIAFALPDGKHKTFTGYIKGQIGEKPRGFNGFGYDPIFFPSGSERTFAEMTDAEKDVVSHRGKAMRKLYAYLRNLL
jgi:XTP/dITP diphosphohydrolase